MKHHAAFFGLHILLLFSITTIQAQLSAKKCMSDYEKAKKLYDQQEYAEAKEIITALQGQCPELTNKCDLLYAHICFDSKDYATAISYYTKYLNTLSNQHGVFDPHDKLLVNRGNAYFNSNMNNEAIVDYQQCIVDIGCYEENTLTKLEIGYVGVLFNLSALYEKKYFETKDARYLYKAVKLIVDLYYFTRKDQRVGEEWVSKIKNRLFNELYNENNQSTLAKSEYRKYAYTFEPYWKNYLKDSLILNKNSYYIDREHHLVIYGNELTYTEIYTQLEQIFKHSRYKDYAILVEVGLGDWENDDLEHIFTQCRTNVNEYSKDEVSMEKRIQKLLQAKGRLGFEVKLSIHDANISVWFDFKKCQLSRELGEKFADGEAGFMRSKSKYFDIAFECECPDFEKIKMVEDLMEDFTIFESSVDLDSLFRKWKISNVNEAQSKPCGFVGSFLIEEVESYNALSRLIETAVRSLKPIEMPSQIDNSSFEWKTESNDAIISLSRADTYGGIIHFNSPDVILFGNEVCPDNYSVSFIGKNGNKQSRSNPLNDSIDFLQSDLPAIIDIQYQEGCHGEYRHLQLQINSMYDYYIEINF